MRVRKTIAIGLVLLLCLVTTATSTTTTSDNPVLQAAANAYAAIGVPTSCGTFSTHNQGTAGNYGGIISNDVCNVGGQWVDANLTMRMNSEQLVAALKTLGSPSGSDLDPIGFNGSDPSTVLVSSVVTASVPMGAAGGTTTRPPLYEGAPVDQGIGGLNTGMAVASAGCAAAGAVNSFFLGGIATEITQLCVHAQMLADAVANVKHLNAFQASLRALGSRSSFGTQARPIRPQVLVDINGEMVGLTRLINGGGIDAAAAWAGGTVRLNAKFLSRENAGSSSHLSNAASVHMVDTFGADALRVAGDIRASQAATLAAVAELQKQADSLDPTVNTPVGQQNITNAALLQIINMQATAQSAQVAMLQQMAANGTWQRNATAVSANNYDAMLDARATRTGDLSGTSSALTYRMP